MAKLLKLRRGTTSQHGSFTGAEGEVTVDTDKETLVVHDGSTAGGHAVAAEDMANVSSANIVGRLGTGSIVKAKLEADIIDGTKLADDAVNSEHYVDASIDHQHLSNDCIDGDNIQDDVVNSEHIAAGAVDLEHMSSESVDEDNLKVSNSGSNGQFLSKQSGNNGGLTWADVDLTPYAPKASPALTGTATGVNLTLSGNLTVNGTTTTVATTNTTLTDNLLELNSGASSNANDAGILIERGSTGDNAIIAWDESADKFTVGTTTGTASSTGNISITTGTLVANVEGNGSGLTNLPAAQLTGTLPSINGGNLTNLTASNLTGSMPAIAAGNLTDINATNLGSGTVPTARLGSGTANSSKVLRGNGTWGAPETVQTTTTSGNSTYYIPFVAGWGSGGSTLYGDSGNSLSYNPSTNVLTSGSFSGSGAGLTSIPAANLTGTLPAISGANLTNIQSDAVVTGTASGTLPNGQAVKVNTNGTFSIASLAPPAFGGGGVSNAATTVMESAEGCYVGNNRFLFCYYSSPHTQARAIVGEVNANGTMTWGSPVVPQTWSNSVSCIAWNHDDEMGIYASNGGGQNFWAIQFTISGLVPTFGTTRGAYINPQDSWKGCLVYGSQNRYMFGYIAYSQFRWTRIVNVTSNVNSAPTGSGGSSYSSGTMYENTKIAGCWNSDASLWTMFYNRNGAMSAHQFQPSGSSIGAQTTHPVTVSGYVPTSFYYQNPQVHYDSVNTKYLFGYNDNNFRQKLRVGDFHVGNAQFTFGTEVNVTDSNDSNEANAFTYAEHPWMCRNNISDEFTVVWGSSGTIKAKDVTISGTTITLGSTYSYSTTLYTSSGSNSLYFLTSRDSSRWMLMYHSSSTASKAVSRAGTSTTISNDNYVGFSKGTFSNGQTATIQLPGTVVDGLSGLTTGSKYYVSGNGTVSLTDTYYTDITAGVALSSSTLLLK